MKTLLSFLTLAALTGLAGNAALAQTTATDPWVRAAVPGQKATGMFVQLQSKTATRLVSVSTPIAGVAEIHEMSMDGGVMRMRAMPGLDLPAGQPVALKPGGFHLMFMDLKQPLKAGDTVPVTLTLENAAKQRETLELKVPVRQLQAPMQH
ncbi:copper chaperone PCu(A)C [Roseateles paludis]|jgi:copper(I)-binding protein|uniref:Copper chaperone PCu(A)C n=1 Tax=Roseateles paludis TaxID=3145238 RepID=A0ABV0G4G1_9BURK